MIDLGVDKGLIEKSGTWISYGGERLGQGRENARIFLKENIGMRDKLEAALRKNLGLPGLPPNPARVRRRTSRKRTGTGETAPKK